MNFTIYTEIKPVETSIEILTEHGIEIDLDTILAELNSELPNDISNGL